MPVPVFDFGDKFLLNRIRQNVKARFGKGVSLSIFLAENIVMRLLLEFDWIVGRRTSFKFRGKMGSEKSHGDDLIRANFHIHPHEVNMVRHQAVGGAEQSLPRGGREQKFTKESMERLVKPPGGAIFKSDRPMHDGEALIELPIQPRQMVHVVHIS